MGVFTLQRVCNMCRFLAHTERESVCKPLSIHKVEAGCVPKKGA